MKHLDAYLSAVRVGRSPLTARTYATALRLFASVAGGAGDTEPTVEDYKAFLSSMSANVSPRTQATYNAAVRGYLQFAAANGASINLAAVNQADKQYRKRSGQRIPHFDRDAVEEVIEAAAELARTKRDLESLRNYAFVLVLASSGLRISEACNLRRGDIDYTGRRAVVIGKGDKQAVVRFTDRALRAVKAYLSARAKLDGAQGVPLASLPLFARHDAGAGNKVKPVRSGGMRKSLQAIPGWLDEGGKPRLTPHTFRHYFVTRVYQRTGDIVVTQELARHADIGTTKRYTHLTGDLDTIYRNAMEAE
ncbi:MAG TPA: tyrosine-type recombinase/integrase [Anaerolineales bacterium]|nr:tyrosine-type recombinase/integrase [Anaerolineales bacterium]